MKTLKVILPAASGSGGTRVGSSFLDDWAVCKFLWYMQHLAPHPKGGHGFDPLYPGEALWLGTVVHKANEGWRLSGWKDGHYDYDAGLAALDAAAEAGREQVAFEDDYTDWRAQAETIVTRYWKYAGPGGTEPDWDRFRILDLAGEPCLEKEFEIDLGWQGYFYTIKPDLVVWRQSDGYLCGFDDKTTNPQKAALNANVMRKRPQLTAQQLAVSLTWPQERAGQMVNLIIKGAAQGKPPRRLESLDRADARLELFRIHTIAKLKDMETHVERYWELLQKGVPEPTAARLIFDDEPSALSCERYNRVCSYIDDCVGADSAIEWHSAQTKPRYTDTAKETQ